MQNGLVALVVLVCAWRVCWTLAPRPLRRWVAQRLRGKLPVAVVPVRWQRALDRAAQAGAGGGCACDAADSPGACQGPAKAEWKPVQWAKPDRRKQP